MATGPTTVTRRVKQFRRSKQTALDIPEGTLLVVDLPEAVTVTQVVMEEARCGRSVALGKTTHQLPEYRQNVLLVGLFRCCPRLSHRLCAHAPDQDGDNSSDASMHIPL